MEKNVEKVTSQYAVSEAGSTVSWSAEEEQKVRRKADLIVMPILMFAFFTLQLDRSNAGNAMTDGFIADIGITQDWFNVGTQLLNAGIVLLEIPSNIILYRVGPQRWIGAQIFIWGLVATFQAFQHGLPAFLSTRLLLGLCEAGFIPGGLYTLSQWYKGAELSKRFALYFMGNGLATASGGLLAYGILHMGGVAGLAGWQWLFILEGIFTVTAGVIFVCFFPGTPSNPVSLIGLRFFSEREQMILRERIVVDDPTKRTGKKNIKLRDVGAALASPTLWPHVLLTIVSLAPSTALWNYAPSIVASFGYNPLASNALTSIGQWMSVFLVLILGFLADRWGRRGFLVLGAVSVEFIFTVAYKCLPDHANASLKFGMLTMAAGTASWWHSLNGSWLSINARSPAERSIRMAMFIMSANCAGIVGGQLFRSDDLPYYHRGWSIAVAFMAFGVACVTVLICMYAFINARMRRSGTAYADSAEKNRVAAPVGENEISPKLYNF